MEKDEEKKKGKKKDDEEGVKEHKEEIKERGEK